MGFYGDWILPRALNLAMGSRRLGREREKALRAVRGTVLEVGFGAGHNLPYYPDGVERVVGVDPSGESARLARKRIEAARFPVEFLPLPGEAIPAGDASFDSVVCTFSLCTIADPVAALRQMCRVLRPDGQFFFLEHGRSHESAVQRWQDRLNGLQRRVSGGCNLNRQMDRLITDAGFEIDALETYYMKGPRVGSYLFRGTARRGA